MAFLTTFVGFLKRTMRLPGLLSFGAKRMVVRAVAPTLSRIGLRLSKIGSVLEQAGIKYKEPQFAQDIILGEKMVKGEGGLPIADVGGIFPISSMIETTMPSGRLYRGFAKVTFIDKESGDIREGWVSFYDNKRRSQDDWERMIGSWYELSESGKIEDIGNIQFQELWHNQGEEY